MAWKKIEGSAGADMWNFEENKELEGTFTHKQENVGPNNSNVYHFEVGEEEVGVWGNTVLDSRLAEVAENTKVKIVYLGKAKSKRGNEYKNFEVYVEEDKVPF